MKQGQWGPSYKSLGFKLLFWSSDLGAKTNSSYSFASSAGPKKYIAVDVLTPSNSFRMIMFDA